MERAVEAEELRPENTQKLLLVRVYGDGRRDGDANDDDDDPGTGRERSAGPQTSRRWMITANAS